MRLSRQFAISVFAVTAFSAPLTGYSADLTPAPASDNLNAVLWDQTSFEFKANALGAYALGRLRLDEALADKSWTAAPVEQTGNY